MSKLDLDKQQLVEMGERLRSSNTSLGKEWAMLAEREER
jgi:hypothetical protein